MMWHRTKAPVTIALVSSGISLLLIGGYHFVKSEKVIKTFNDSQHIRIVARTPERAAESFIMAFAEGHLELAQKLCCCKARRELLLVAKKTHQITNDRKNGKKNQKNGQSQKNGLEAVGAKAEWVGAAIEYGSNELVRFFVRESQRFSSEKMLLVGGFESDHNGHIKQYDVELTMLKQKSHWVVQRLRIYH